MQGRIESLGAELVGIVGEQHVLDKAAVAALEPGYHPDNLAAGLAVLPGNTAEVSKIISLCQREGIGMVPQGGRTGLSGGAVCAPDQLLVGLSRMSRVEKLDPLAAIAVVEAGATLQSVEDAVRQHRLTTGIDLAARGSATIGGMISTNAGGMEAFRNGSMRNRVIGLEVVLASGEVFNDMTEVTKCNEGYDIKQLFCGAEGTLGIVTRAVLRLEPESLAPMTLLLACADAASAFGIMRTCQRAADLDLLHAEIMWRSAAERIAREIGLRKVLSFCRAEVYVILEVACRSRAIGVDDALHDVFEDPALDGAILDALFAKNERERRDIWSIRENSAAVDANSPNHLWFDVSVPLTRLDDYVGSVERKIAGFDPSIGVYVLGHLGDGNLHYSIGSGETLTDAVQQSITDAVYEDLKQIGGSFSAEHGIGVEKRSSLQKYASPEKRQLMLEMKRAFDPKGVMNPGKVV